MSAPWNWSFEPTYEELKLTIRKAEEDLRSLFWAYLWGIETMVIFQGPLKASSFEPTYEELKLPKKFCPPKYLIEVLSLPMRNWNFDLLIVLLDCNQKFWAYLWGIETIPFFPLPLHFPLSFEPTYEELKL